MTDRDRVLAEVFARAKLAGKRVYGYCSDKAGCAEMPKKGVPENWNRVCVEGDAAWTAIPAADEQANTEAGAA